MENLHFVTLKEAAATGQGIILVDKPAGWTSHDVVGWIRRQVGVKRVGHAGTLDPLATGLLVVLVGREFTKLQDSFMKQDKVYSVTARFGVTTDSYDSDGAVVAEKSWEEIAKLDGVAVSEAMLGFVGKISQTVPIYSAVKIAGQKLYEKARAGEVVAALPVRQVEIKKFSLLGFVKDEAKQICEAQLLAEVSSGTYIRSLVHDLGQKLGLGAHVTVLRRESIGELQVTGALVPGDVTKITV